MKIIFEVWSSGTFEFQEGDELDLEKPLHIEYGLFSSIPIKGDGFESYESIESGFEYDSPEQEYLTPINEQN